VSVSPSAVVTAGTTVTLDGSESQYAVNFSWEQTSGPQVTLVRATPSGSRVSFVTPPLGATLEFTLTVSGLGRASDPVPISVLSRSAPSAPQSVSATAGATSATVSWTAPANDGLSPITGYDIDVTPGGVTVQAAAGATSALISGLQPGLGYVFSVSAVNAIGKGTPASTGSVHIPTLPGPPVGISAVSTNTGGTLQVSWTPPADTGGVPLSGYTINCIPTATGTAPGTATSGLVTGLTNGTSYTCTVRAQNGAGSSTASFAATATPLGPPGVPIGFSATSAGGANWSLSWSAPTDTGGLGLTGYVVTWTPATSGSPRSLPVSPTSVTLGAAEGLLAATSYTFSLSAVNSIGVGVAATTTPPGKAVITSPIAGASTGANQIPVTWTAAAPNGSTISQYTVRAQVSGGGAITSITVPGTQLFGTVTGLANCTSHDVSVIATSGGGSTTSDVILGVTPRQAPDAPTGLSVSKGAGVGDFNLSWLASNGHGCTPVQYTVQVTDPVSGATLLSPVTSTAVAFNTTTPACPYVVGNGVNCSSPRVWSFRVRASNSAPSPSAFSLAATGTPRVGFSRDTVFNIWTATLSSTTCTSCHRPGGSGLPLDLTGLAGSLTSINANSPPVIASPTANSYLLACPVGDTTICPFTTMTGRNPHFFNGTSSPEYQVIQQWINDGHLP
jgi:hypothetical protein